LCIDDDDRQLPFRRGGCRLVLLPDGGGSIDGPARSPFGRRRRVDSDGRQRFFFTALRIRDPTWRK